MIGFYNNNIYNAYERLKIKNTLKNILYNFSQFYVTTTTFRLNVI